MKMKLQIIACALATVAIGQAAVKAFADELPAKILTRELESKVVLMLQQKNVIESQGGSLSLAERAELVRGLKQLTENAKKAQVSGMLNHESPGV